ncbi:MULTISPECIES: hypothetical protein [Corynebacterium]|uniref:hypothetical protein n=1 Tax=Corynebacterium TaxID=1716 RepID=UPI0011C85B44|nr:MULTISPECIES: hypothetical protein [unclassified Corynebacterium]MDK8828578.1 hypothetical protein [Corynebacterium sp. MSK012]TXS79279.1 hypothetical protein CHU72_09215 [Corynebacterium sp. LK12]
MIESFDALAARTTVFLAQNPTGPRGADFGKASPIGLLIIVVLLIVILALGWDLSRRAKRMAARRKFAEAHGMDPFDSEAVDKAMAAAEQRREAE